MKLFKIKIITLIFTLAISFQFAPLFCDRALAVAGVDWTALTPGTDTGIKFGTEDAFGVAYGNNTYVAVGANGKASYSSDGINWTSSSSTGLSNARSVSFGNGKFVAVGLQGQAAYSTDGITWLLVDTKFGSTWMWSVAYGNGVFVAVGTSGYASYSSDGITWTALPHASDGSDGIKFGAITVNFVTYVNNKFLAVGRSGYASYSADGITWTALPHATDGSDGIKFGATHAVWVSYGNNKYVVVGNFGKASYSSDGITWTSLPAGVDTGVKFGTSNSVSSVAYGNGIFVAAGTIGYASYSADGITWTALPHATDGSDGIKFGATPLNYLWSVNYLFNKFIIVGNSGKASYSVVPPNTAPTLTSIAATPTPIKGGSTITITPTGHGDADLNSLNYYCNETGTTGGQAPTSANTLCTNGTPTGNQSYASDYSTATCTYATASDNTTHNVYCRTYDGTDYSAEQTITFVTDSTAPTITVTNPNTSSALNKTITASTSDGTLTMSNTTGSVCDSTLTFITYVSQTFNTESDNTTKVCYKATDAVGNIAYSLSNAITGIDTTAPITPLATPAGTIYNTIQLVSLSSEGNSNIYYTINSDTPTTSSTLYVTSININETTTIKALAVDIVGNESGIMTEVYTINIPTGGGNANQVFLPAKIATALPTGSSYNNYTTRQTLITEIKVKLIDLIRQLIILLQEEMRKSI